LKRCWFTLCEAALEAAKGRRAIGQEAMGFVRRERHCGLDEMAAAIDWAPLAARLDAISPPGRGEPGWPPLALFRALLLAQWHDLSDVDLAEALDDRASFRRFCGFAASEAVPERTAFVRFRRGAGAAAAGEVRCLQRWSASSTRAG
jgi:IS5 family transposase